MENQYFFEDVTLLITHYNRSQSLETLLKSFRLLGCSFGEIVVSDDGSKPEHIEYLHTLRGQFDFRLVTTPQNKGLGNNINKGQLAATRPLTLYVQEDFTPTAIFPQKFRKALELMRENRDLDMVRFYAYFEYPYLKNGDEGFHKISFALWKPGYRKFYVYSDHPHLRRSSFLEKFGRYPEGCKGDVTEYGMMMSFLKKKGQAMFYQDFKGLFIQKNSESEPSTMKRNAWRESENFFVTQLRHLYRHLKFNIDYLFNYS